MAKKKTTPPKRRKTRTLTIGPLVLETLLRAALRTKDLPKPQKAELVRILRKLYA